MAMTLGRALTLALLGLPVVGSAATAVVTTERVRAELVAHVPQGLAPGREMWLGLRIRHQPGWHTYWKNPGDSGLPTTLAWQLPPGVQAAGIAWPTPKRLPVGPLVNYGYEGDLLLPVPVTVSDAFAAPELEVRLRADWLVCKELCIPESGEFALTLPRDAAIASHGDLFAAAWARAPVEAGAVARGRVDARTLSIDVDGLPASLRGRTLGLFAETAGVIEHAALPRQQWNGARWSARVALSPQRSESPSTMPLVLTGAEAAGVLVRVDIAGPWPSPVPAASGGGGTAVAGGASGPGSLLPAVALALLGGVLLNLMPCVFPVLSLKVIGFARSGQDRRSLFGGGLAYTAGVVGSFLALAGVLLALRAGGEQVGWGFQLQSPTFIAALAVLFTLIGLNLAGIFEVRTLLPGKLASVRGRHPLTDHALTGALAVAVASPCTAPFMGIALGTTLVLPAAESMMVFAALGLGMALPFLALSALPGLARRLPRPGPWMARFKRLMAFPMFATVVWLVWVLGQQVGIDGAAGLLAVLVAAAFAAWALGTPGFGRRARAFFVAAAGLVLAATIGWTWQGIHQPEAPVIAGRSAVDVRWQAWSVEGQAAARADGRPVLVDFTAAWCVTCQVVRRTTFADKALLAELDARKVVLLRADWTRRDPLITQALAQLGRSGVPVYAYYPAGAARPVLLPEFLTVADVRQALAAPQTGP